MSQIVKLRRSSTSGNRPTNSQLQLGELAINTTDGKLYFSKSGSLNTSIEEVLTTNAQNTGSLNISGSINLIGTESITGSLNVTGSLRVLGDTSLTSLLVSGSDPVANVQAFLPDSTVYNNASFNTPDRVSSGIRFNWSNENWTIGAARGLTTDVNGLLFSKNGERKYMIDEDGNASLSGSMTVTGSLNVNSDVIINGSVTAREFHTDYLTASVIYSSGSTRFGDTPDDTHIFTGSVNITGSLYVNGAVVGTGKLDSTEFYTYTSSATSTIASSSYAQTASYVLNPIVVSGVTRTSVVSSPTETWSFNHQMGQKYPSIQIFDNDGYVVVPSEIKAVDENNVNVYFSQPQTGVLSVTLGGAGTAGTSGTSGINGTSGTSGRDGLGGYTNTFTASTTWSVAHNLGMDFPIVTAWDTNRKVVLPTEIYSVDDDNIEIYFSQPIAGTISVIKIL